MPYIYRRKDGLIDLMTEVLENSGDFAESYDFKYAANWDGVYTSFQVVPKYGMTSATVKPDPVSYSMKNYVRFRFDPADYGQDGTNTGYYVVEPTLGSVAQGNERIIIIPPTNFYNQRSPVLVLRGNAPLQATPLDFKLPLQTISVQVDNLGANEVELTLGSGTVGILIAATQSYKVDLVSVGVIGIRSTTTGASSVQISASLNNGIEL